MPDTSISPLLRAVLITSNIGLPILNQSHKQASPIAQWFAKNACERGVLTPLQAVLVAELYMQMCSECRVCRVKTQKFATNAYGYFNFLPAYEGP